MNCQQAKERIHLYLDEQLTASEVDKLLEHISSCEECQKELTFWQSLTSAIQAGALREEPDDFTENLMKSLPDRILKRHRYDYIAFGVGLLFMATIVFYSGWFFRGIITNFALSSTAFVEDVIPSSISSFGQWFKSVVDSMDGLFDKLINFRLWNFVFWIIIVCGITTVVMQTIAIVEITTRQKR